MGMLLLVLLAYILSIPYCFLAGVESDSYRCFILGVAPIVTISLYVVQISYEKWIYDGGKPSKYGNVVFWILLVYFHLPIIINGLSFALRRAGYSELAKYAFDFRFYSLLVVCVLFLAFALITSKASLQKTKRI